MAKDDCDGVDGLKELGEIPTNIDELNEILALIIFMTRACKKIKKNFYKSIDK